MPHRPAEHPAAPLCHRETLVAAMAMRLLRELGLSKPALSAGNAGVDLLLGIEDLTVDFRELGREALLEEAFGDLRLSLAFGLGLLERRLEEMAARPVVEAERDAQATWPGVALDGMTS